MTWLSCFVPTRLIAHFCCETHTHTGEEYSNKKGIGWWSVNNQSRPRNPTPERASCGVDVDDDDERRPVIWSAHVSDWVFFPMTIGKPTPGWGHADWFRVQNLLERWCRTRDSTRNLITRWVLQTNPKEKKKEKSQRAGNRRKRTIPRFYGRAYTTIEAIT